MVYRSGLYFHNGKGNVGKWAWYNCTVFKEKHQQWHALQLKPHHWDTLFSGKLQVKKKAMNDNIFLLHSWSTVLRSILIQQLNVRKSNTNFSQRIGNNIRNERDVDMLFI